jgi:hypothetical protein
MRNSKANPRTASLTRSSNINCLIWRLIAIVAGSLSRLPNRCVCIEMLLGCRERSSFNSGSRALNVWRTPDLEEIHSRHTRKEGRIAKPLSVPGNGVNWLPVLGAFPSIKVVAGVSSVQPPGSDLASDSKANKG